MHSPVRIQVVCNHLLQCCILMLRTGTLCSTKTHGLESGSGVRGTLPFLVYLPFRLQLLHFFQFLPVKIYNSVCEG